MPEKIITYFGQRAKVACDGRCDKAWGISSRPSVKLSSDPDDYEMLSDDELGEAPINPRTSEGGHTKPASASEFPNKWCVRECERCSMSDPGKWNEPVELNRFDSRKQNKV